MLSVQDINCRWFCYGGNYKHRIELVNFLPNCNKSNSICQKYFLKWHVVNVASNGKMNIVNELLHNLFMRNFVVLSKIPEIPWNSLMWEQNINKCQHLYMEITWWTRHNYFIGFF